MVPRTFPSTYSSSGQQQMVVYFLPSVQNLKRWSDYIPVKLSTGGKENSYDNNGFISVAVTNQIAGRVAFKDYVPVYVDNAATDAWRINSVGYIPYGYSGTGDATLVLDFLNASTLDSKITFTRASNATQFDSSGNLVFAPNNSIRNNMMVGAVAGSPGTLPTNWGVNAVSGITVSVSSVSAENGITYVDLNFSGTAGATGNQFVAFDTIGGIAAANAQTWTHSIYIKQVTSVALPTVSVSWRTYDSLSVLVTATGASATVADNSANLRTARQAYSATLSGATIASIRPTVEISLVSGTAYNFTLRIGMPQLERGSTATAVNATSGTAYHGPRFDYDPSTLASRGLLIEEQRTNSIRNNTMQGAVAGTPGTLPTNWNVSGLGTLTQTVVGTGTLNGVSYIDIRFSGTTSTTQFGIRFEPSNGIAGTNGQTFSFSSWVALAAGSLTNINYFFCNANLYNASNAYLSTPTFSGFDGASLTASLTRRAGTLTIASATSAFIQPQIGFTFASGASIDLTVRIGLPQLELGGSATSAIATSTTTVTRSADRASITTLSPWYNATTGTVFAEFSLAQPASGGNQFITRFSDNTYNNAIANNVESAGGAQISTASGGVFDGLASAAIVLSANTVTKIAGAYAANNIAISKDGGAVVTDTTATIPSGLTRLDIGSDHGGANQVKSGYIRRITYYPSRLSNAALQQITTL